MSLSQAPVGLCLDTAHAFAAGYNLRLAAGRKMLLREIATGPGLQALKVIHLNDSLLPCGSHRDRHWHWARELLAFQGWADSCKAVPPG